MRRAEARISRATLIPGAKSGMSRKVTTLRAKAVRRSELELGCVIAAAGE
jgi:hypothetical protein